MTKIKNLLLQNHWAHFNQTWHKVSLVEENSNLFKWRATPFFKGEIITNCENTLTKFKNYLLLQNHWVIFNQTWHKALDSIFLYEGPTPSQRGDNYKIVQMHWQMLKSSSPELLDRFYPNLTQSLLGWRGFIFYL